MYIYLIYKLICIFCQQFYIIESNLEVLARHILFLSLLMEPPDQLGYQGWLIYVNLISLFLHNQ